MTAILTAMGILVLLITVAYVLGMIMSHLETRGYRKDFPCHHRRKGSKEDRK